MANIRDQDSWVHQSDKEGATKKAKDLVRMAVANAAELSPLYRSTLPVVKRALIIGGGIAGMTAALNIAHQGFEVVLVEIEKELGGMGRKIHRTLQGDNIQKYVDDLLEKVTQNEKNRDYCCRFFRHQGKFQNSADCGTCHVSQGDKSRGTYCSYRCP